MRIIKVTDGTIPVTYDGSEGEPKGTKQESHFWFCLKIIMRAMMNSMSGAQILEFEDLDEEVLAQVGKSTLRIKREAEYEKLTGWVEQYEGWPGKRKDITDMVRAFRNAEKVKETKEGPVHGESKKS